ncbi:MAG: OmpA family protein [Cyclobacteriaceae bacterium]|nr:OmpA family protein [Cyclobacteriaceae bacterium]
MSFAAVPPRLRTRIYIPILWLTSCLLCTGCVRGVFHPVNVGREYGDKVPIMVSHLPKPYQASGEGHWPGQKIICFNYMCRTIIGKKKAMKQISFDDFKKRVRKNAKKGEYKDLKPIVPKQAPKKMVPAPEPIRAPKDSIATIVTTQEPAAPLLKADSLITLGDLLFETNSFVLKGQHYAALDSLAKFLTKYPVINVSISGHTDNTGTEHHNVALSTKRAGSVYDYLVKAGVDLHRISFEGFGSSKPIDSNDRPEGRSKNRRVEVLLSNPNKK